MHALCAIGASDPMELYMVVRLQVYNVNQMLVFSKSIDGSQPLNHASSSKRGTFKRTILYDEVSWVERTFWNWS